MQGISRQYMEIKIQHFLLRILLKYKTKAIRNENMFKGQDTDSHNITESLRRQPDLAFEVRVVTRLFYYSFPIYSLILGLYIATIEL